MTWNEDLSNVRRICCCHVDWMICIFAALHRSCVSQVT